MIQRSKVWSANERRVVFLDLMGTLHQQDMFGSFLAFIFAAPSAAKCAARTAVAAHYRYRFTGKGRAARWPMSLLLWGCTFTIAKRVCRRIRRILSVGFALTSMAFPAVQERLTTYLLSLTRYSGYYRFSAILGRASLFDTPWRRALTLSPARWRDGMAAGY